MKNLIRLFNNELKPIFGVLIILNIVVNGKMDCNVERVLKSLILIKKNYHLNLMVILMGVTVMDMVSCILIINYIIRVIFIKINLMMIMENYII